MLKVLLAFVFALDIGSYAPLGKALNQDGKEMSLAKIYDSSTYVLVYFYPKAGTPGCTKQACSLRDAYTTLQKKGVRVIGVSTDNVKEQKAFQKKHRLPFDLLADTKKEIAKAFSVPVRIGFASRQAFLIKEGKVVWMDRSASTSEQAADILKFLNQKE